MNYRPIVIAAFGAFLFVVLSNLPGGLMGMGAAQAGQTQSVAQASQALELAQSAATIKPSLEATTQDPLEGGERPSPPVGASPPVEATTTPKPGNCSASSADGKDVCTTNCDLGQVASCGDGDPPSCACR